MRYKKKRPATPELIAAVRKCAADGLNMDRAAAVLTTVRVRLTRNSIAGIAYRNGIQFTNERGPDRKPRKPRNSDHKPKQPCFPQLRPSRVPVWRHNTLHKAPAARCSWSGCECAAEPGDMFCAWHSKKALT